uniref:Uncharacterized protein n=1 Tax=Tanacetum cinerariifolium TaxID=118510 RepID=A0A6L2NKZ5_TANCI|nr:hypothetical protein [Tanacetum cinerariifolium]
MKGCFELLDDRQGKDVHMVCLDMLIYKHKLRTIVVLKGVLGTRSFVILIKTPDLSQRPPQNCPKCGNPVDGHYCQGCALLRKKFKEDLFTSCMKMEFSKILPSHPMTIPTLLMLFKSHSLLIKTQLCGRGAHYGYNCPPKVSVVTDLEPFNNQTVDELPQTVPSFDPTCYSEDGNSFTYDSTSNLVHDSPNVFNPPLQPLTYSYEFSGNDAYYSHDCSLQVPFTYNPKPLYINTLSWDHPTVCYDDDDDEDYAIAVTPSLSTEEPDNSLSMEDEHLDTIPITESNEFIKSSVESLVSIPSESEGIPDNMYDVPFHENSLPLDILKDQFKDFFDSNDDSTAYDEDSFSITNIEYVEASPPDSELVSLEVMEIVIPKVGGF